MKLFSNLMLVLFLCAYGAGPAFALDADEIMLGVPADKEAAKKLKKGRKEALPIRPESGSGAIIMPSLEYRIGPFDLLEIEVYKVPDLSGSERVDSAGYVNIPLIGPVKVVGLTQSEAENLIAEKLGQDYLQNPQVNIDIAEYASQQVTVMGAVKKPGVYALRGGTTLLQVLAMAGGSQKWAKTSKIVVFRTDKDGAVTGYVVDFDEITTGEKEDPVIIANDRIVVPESMVLLRNIGSTFRNFIGLVPY